jgi:predicted Zn-dependent protease
MYILKQDPDAGEFWYYLSAAQKKLGDFQKALEAGLKSYETHERFSIEFDQYCRFISIVGKSQ